MVFFIIILIIQSFLLDIVNKKMFDCYNLCLVPLTILAVFIFKQGSQTLTLHIPPMQMVSFQYLGPPNLWDSPRNR
jgi:hypothetical protein